MRRLFWLALGATVGILVVRKLSRAAEKLTPESVARGFTSGLNELAFSLRDFAADVREAMASHEASLRQAAGLDSGTDATGRSLGAVEAAPPVAGPLTDPA